MENENIENHAKLIKGVLQSIVDNLDGEFKHSCNHNNHMFSRIGINECSVHAFKDRQSFNFSIRSRTVKDQETMLNVLKNIYPFDMTLYKSTINILSELYQMLSFTVKPVEIKNIEDFSWMSFFRRTREGSINWENFDHFYYNFELYPWNKSVTNLSVTQKIKMILIEDNGIKKYIPVMESSLPLNVSKRSKICISMDKNIPNIYVFSNKGFYEIATLENILIMVNKAIRNYIFNILSRRYQIEISKNDFANIESDNFFKYIALHEMIEI